jgi:hypothetical protein
MDNRQLKLINIIYSLANIHTTVLYTNNSLNSAYTERRITKCRITKRKKNVEWQNVNFDATKRRHNKSMTLQNIDTTNQQGI